MRYWSDISWHFAVCAFCFIDQTEDRCVDPFTEPAEEAPARRREEILDAALALLEEHGYRDTTMLLWRAHVANVDAPARAKKAALHAAVLANRAPDPYQYKLHTITWAVERLHRATGVDVFDLYAANALLSLVVLLFAHQAWLGAPSI